MIALTNEQIESIRKLSESKIREKYGQEVELYIQEYKIGEYINYAVKGSFSEDEILDCQQIITRTGSVIAKVYLDEGYGN